MRTTVLLAGLVVVLTGCGRKTNPVSTYPGPSRSVDVGQASEPQAARGPARGPRHLNGVPPGHYPKPGECRLWIPGTPPGRQAKPTACSNLRGRVPAGAFVLYGDRAWDADYDWAAQARRESTSVPQTILDVLRGRR